MANPITLFMPVIPGVSPQVVNELLTKGRPAINTALRAIGTVHFARFTLLDRSQPNLQLDINKMGEPSDTLVIGIITEYDGDFDAYISDFVAHLGGVFNALLECIIGGAAVTPVADNIVEFQALVTANDASQHEPNISLYSAYPQTVQKILAVFEP